MKQNRWSIKKSPLILCFLILTTFNTISAESCNDDYDCICAPSGTFCSQCTGLKYVGANGFCRPCSSGCQECVNSVFCTVCQDDYELSSDKRKCEKPSTSVGSIILYIFLGIVGIIAVILVFGCCIRGVRTANENKRLRNRRKERQRLIDRRKKEEEAEKERRRLAQQQGPAIPVHYPVARPVNPQQNGGSAMPLIHEIKLPSTPLEFLGTDLRDTNGKQVSHHALAGISLVGVYFPTDSNFVFGSKLFHFYTTVNGSQVKMMEIVEVVSSGAFQGGRRTPWMKLSNPQGVIQTRTHLQPEFSQTEARLIVIRTRDGKIIARNGAREISVNGPSSIGRWLDQP